MSRKNKLNISKLPKTGDFVIDSQGNNIKLLEQVGLTGGEGSCYKLANNNICKIFNVDKLTKKREDKIKSMLCDKVNNKSISWPLDYVMYNGVFVGYTMKFFENNMFLAHICSDRRDTITYINKKSDMVSICLNLLKIVMDLHSKKIVIGDLSLRNFLFKENKVYLIDVDSIQYKDYSCDVYTDDYVAPEYISDTYELTNVEFKTIDSENFNVARILFKLLVGDDAYNSKKNTGYNSLEYIKNGDFCYLVGEKGDPYILNEGSEKVWLGLPKYIQNFFYNTFKHDGKYNKPGTRLTCYKWYEYLSIYKKELESGKIRDNLFFDEIFREQTRKQNTFQKKEIVKKEIIKETIKKDDQKRNINKEFPKEDRKINVKKQIISIKEFRKNKKDEVVTSIEKYLEINENDSIEFKYYLRRVKNHFLKQIDLCEKEEHINIVVGKFVSKMNEGFFKNQYTYYLMIDNLIRKTLVKIHDEIKEECVTKIKKVSDDLIVNFEYKNPKVFHDEALNIYQDYIKNSKFIEYNQRKEKENKEFEIQGTRLVKCMKNCKRITIPKTVKSISSHAFDYLDKVEVIEVSKRVNRIEEEAFNGLYSLRELKLQGTNVICDKHIIWGIEHQPTVVLRGCRIYLWDENWLVYKGKVFKKKCNVEYVDTD